MTLSEFKMPMMDGNLNYNLFFFVFLVSLDTRERRGNHEDNHQVEGEDAKKTKKRKTIIKKIDSKDDDAHVSR